MGEIFLHSPLSATTQLEFKGFPSPNPKHWPWLDYHQPHQWWNFQRQNPNESSPSLWGSSSADPHHMQFWALTFPWTNPSPKSSVWAEHLPKRLSHGQDNKLVRGESSLQPLLCLWQCINNPMPAGAVGFLNARTVTLSPGVGCFTGKDTAVAESVAGG